MGLEKMRPVFFPSISSLKTNFTPTEYFSLLDSLKYPYLLVSAYDLAKLELPINIKKVEGRTLLMDSGNYEAYWLDDKSWNLDEHIEMISKYPADLFLAFDDPWKRIATPDIQVYQRPKEEIVPIIHGTPDTMMENVTSFLSQDPLCKLMAIPERELGDGIIERVSLMHQICQLVEDNNSEIPIHLLGTGNPRSILMFSASGVQSFDGLEWCQTLIDPNNAYLLHSSHRDLVQCGCLSCISDEASYSKKSLIHNLLFYADWMNRISELLQANRIEEMLDEYIPPNVLEATGLLD